MASRNGLSKREYAKAQAAKSTKISTPVRKSSTSSSSKSSTPAGAIGQNRDGSYIYANGSSQNYTPVNANYTSAKTGLPSYAPDPTVAPKKSSGGSSSSNKSSSSSKPSNVKSTAAKLFSSALGSTAEASSGPVNNNGISLRPIQTKNTAGNILTEAKKIATEVIPGGRFLNSVGDLGLTELLGLNTRKNAGTADYVDDQGQVLGGQDQMTLGLMAQNNGGAIPDNAAELLQASKVRPNGSIFRDQQQSPNYTPATGRTPRPVSAPFTPAPSTNISPEIPASFEPQDFSPVSQSQPGTQRRFVGNGNFSNGQFNNGQGNYGVQGTLTGTEGNTNPLEDLLQSLLGSKAEAAGMPQASFDQNASFAPQASFIPQVASFAPQNSMNSYQNSFGALNNIQRQAAPNFQSNISSTPSTQDLPQTTPTPAPRMNGGGVAQQFAQGATGGNPLTNYYTQQEKGYSAQEKAQKRALNELLKSIKNQYKTEQKTGESKLEKSKQEDLLKLSGLFSFANQDPNSEQRIQYENRLSQDYATQLSDFLSQLASQRGQAVSQAKQGYQSQLAGIADKRNATSLELAKLQAAATGKGSGGSRSAASPRVSHNDIFNWTQDALQKGYTWQEIADSAAQQGIGTETGGYLDTLLKNAFKA